MKTDGVRHTAANVIVVGVEEDLMGVIREVLAAEAVLPARPTPFEEAVDTALTSYPDVILVGFSTDPDKAEALARELLKERVTAPLIALSKAQDAVQILRAMRAGYNEFVVLPAEAEQLRAAVKGAAFAVTDNDAKGSVIAIAGAKGGVGTSFLTVHLAAELAAIHRVLVLDFDFVMGDLAPMTDIVPKDTIGDMLERAAEMDERTLAGAAFVHATKVHYLCQPNDIDSIGEVRSEDVFAVLNAAAGAYQYVLVDCGTSFDEATTTAFNVADQVFIIATPDVVSVRDCHRKLNALNGLGVERKRIQVVLNKVPEEPFLTRDTIETNLGITVMGQVREDSRRVEHAMNDGKLVKDLYPKSEVAVDLARLVGLLSDDPDELAAAASEPAKASKGFFARLFGRA